MLFCAFFCVIAMNGVFATSGVGVEAIRKELKEELAQKPEERWLVWQNQLRALNPFQLSPENRFIRACLIGEISVEDIGSISSDELNKIFKTLAWYNDHTLAFYLWLESVRRVHPPKTSLEKISHLISLIPASIIDFNRETCGSAPGPDPHPQREELVEYPKFIFDLRSHNPVGLQMGMSHNVLDDTSIRELLIVARDYQLRKILLSMVGWYYDDILQKYREPYATFASADLWKSELRWKTGENFPNYIQSVDLDLVFPSSYNEDNSKKIPIDKTSRDELKKLGDWLSRNPHVKYVNFRFFTPFGILSIEKINDFSQRCNDVLSLQSGRNDILVVNRHKINIF